MRLFLFLLTTVTLNTPATPVFAQIRGVKYDVTFDSATALDHTIKVAMSFEPATPATPATSVPVLLSLPAWTPGAYEISDFAKWVSNFSATQNGKAIRWDKVDHDTWRVWPAGTGRVTTSFDYRADSLDNAMSWSRPDFLMFNGTNIFMYPERQSLSYSATVNVHTDKRWNVATGMDGSSATRVYTASNYHDLVDMPFFIGRFDVDSAQVSGTWVRYATYPVGSVTGATRTRLWNDIKRMIPPQAAVFGETPWRTYIILQITSQAYGGASGLEHQNSHLDIIAPAVLANPVLSSLYAHEIFHAWNVKRLRPAELWPYRYDEKQNTALLWISEGITDYYADISLVRAGVITRDEFYNTTAGKISEVEATPPVALEDASLSTWIHPTDGTGYVYYPKGSLAGFLLDIMIRDASDNKSSLDAVMRNLYNTTYKRSTGFNNEQFWRLVTSAAGVAGGKSFTDFYNRYVDGRDPYPYDAVLKLAGMRMTPDTIREPRLGVSTGMDSSGVRVIAIMPGSSAESAGVRVGDYITVVGNIQVTDPEFGIKFREAYARATPGTPLSISVRRGSETLTLSGALKFIERMQPRITDDTGATAKAVRIRESLLKGV